MNSKLRFVQAGVRLMAVGILVVAPAGVLADPTEEHEACATATRDQARRLGDEFARQANYRLAGTCYAAAEEYALANRAFIHAAEPESQAVGHQMVEMRDQTKALVRKVQKSLGGKH
jgi:hypothetical protein